MDGFNTRPCQTKYIRVVLINYQGKRRAPLRYYFGTATVYSRTAMMEGEQEFLNLYILWTKKPSIVDLWSLLERISTARMVWTVIGSDVDEPCSSMDAFHAVADAAVFRSEALGTETSFWGGCYRYCSLFAAHRGFDRCITVIMLQSRWCGWHQTHLGWSADDLSFNWQDERPLPYFTST